MLGYVEEGHRGPTSQGARPIGGWAYPPPSWAHGGSPDVFSVPDILKYSKKNHISFSGHLENFYFRGIFIARINQKTDRKYYFCFFNLNNRK